ncbi:MAG: hypothetical protein RJQ09_21455 [Cyclobacteriaceae bacterium]
MRKKSIINLLYVAVIFAASLAVSSCNEPDDMPEPMVPVSLSDIDELPSSNIRTTNGHTPPPPPPPPPGDDD